MKLKIPIYAKVKARNALILNSKLPKSKRFGLTPKEANKLGINSGITRARQLINNKYVHEDDMKSICRFSRFLKIKRTEKVQGVIDLWGGEKFIKEVCIYLRNRK